MRWRGWSRLRRLGGLLVVVALLLLAVGLPLRAWGKHGQDFDRWVGWANILALSVTVAGLLLTLIDRRRQADDIAGERLARVADALNRQILDRESLALQRLLGTGRSGSVAANVEFAERLVVFAQPGTGRSGRLDEVGQFYREHADGRRLVILGEPGSGKTVLALQLLVQQAEARKTESDGGSPAVLPVPVRASLPTWNTDVPFADWLAGRLVADYGVPDRDAAALVNDRRLMPVLDGLDEMDPPGRPPDRATAAVTALNEYVSGENGAPLVLTCRQAEYVALRHPVRPATEVAIQPLDAEQIRDYVRREIGPGATPAEGESWQELLDHVDVPAYAGLREALSTPWRLTLAVSFSRGGGDPTALLPTERERADRPAATYLARVAELLLGQFIPARVGISGGGRYTPDQVVGWLHAVATHLAWQQDNGLSGTDIVLHEWWRVAGEQRVRAWHACVNVALCLVLVSIVGVAVNGGSVGAATANVRHYFDGFPALPAAYLVAGIQVIGLFTVIPLIGWWAGHRSDVPPTEANLQQLRTVPGRRRLLGWLAIGLVTGLALGLAAGLALDFPGGLAGWLALGPAGGLWAGLLYGLSPMGASGLNPRDPLRNDLVLWLASGSAGGLSTGLAVGLAVGPAAGLAVGLAAGLAAGLATGVAGNAWWRYVIAVAVMGPRRTQPWRPARLLTWCYQAGILREAGNAYQFRHIELRDWLQAGPLMRRPSMLPQPSAPPDSFTPADTVSD